ncbi:MAG: YicC family protein [Acidobacteriota bacterium]
MILSMTGYGTGSAQKDDIAVSVEIRTVNHRFLDLHTRISREFLFLEGEIQKLVRKALDRGRVELNVSVQHTGPTVFSVNDSLAKGYLDAADKLRESFNIEGSLDMKTVLSLPGILQNQDTLPDMKDTLSELTRASVESALEGVLKMRIQEGKTLLEDMSQHLGEIKQGTERIEALSQSAAAEVLEKLQERISQLLPQGTAIIDPQRLAQEAALLADKSDISEEIIRLKSHIDQYRSLMDSNEKAGKKLDFLLQELYREANTILSKSGDLEVANFAIGIKAQIEKLREQVQNVE